MIIRMWIFNVNLLCIYYTQLYGASGKEWARGIDGGAARLCTQHLVAADDKLTCSESHI